MAEIFGVVAGVAGLATASKDLHKGLVALRDARQQLREAPRELDRLTAELQFLTDLVRVLIPREQTIKDKYLNGASMLKHCVEGCQEVLEMLTDLQLKYSKALTTKKRKKPSKLAEFRGWQGDVNILNSRIVDVKHNLSLISGLGSFRDTQIEEILVLTREERRPTSSDLEKHETVIASNHSPSPRITEHTLSEAYTYTCEQFNARYVRKRRTDCAKRTCPCSCHRTRSSYGRFWSFNYTPMKIFKSACTLSTCAGTIYGVDVRVVLTPLGLLWAAQVQLQVSLASGAGLVRSALAVNRVVPRDSPGFKVIAELFFEDVHISRFDDCIEFRCKKAIEDVDFQKARKELLQMSQEDSSFVRHTDPAGGTYLELFLSLFLRSRYCDQRMLDLFRFTVVELQLLDYANTTRLLSKFFWPAFGKRDEGILHTLLEAGMDPADTDTPTMITLDMPEVANYGMVFWVNNCLRLLCHSSPGLYSMTPLHEAILLQQSDEVIMDWLSRSAPSEKNSLGQTPLHLCIQHPRQTALLIDAGHDVNAEDVYGNSPLRFAIKSAVFDDSDCSEETIAMLLAAGASINTDKDLFDIARAGATISARIILSLQDRGDPETARVVCNYVLPRLLERKGHNLLKPFMVGGEIVQERTLLGYFLRVRPSLFIQHSFADLPDQSLLEFIPSVEYLRIISEHFDIESHRDHVNQGAITLLSPIRPDPQSDFCITALSDMIEFTLDLGLDVNLPDCQGHSPLCYRLVDVHYWLLRSQAKDILHRLNEMMSNSQRIALVLEAVALLLRKGADSSLDDQCRCSCSPSGCLPLATTTACTAFDEQRLLSSRVLFPIVAIVYLEMLRDNRGVSEARRALLNFIRKTKHEELGMTRVCCFKEGHYANLSLGILDYYQPNIPDDDINEILDEETDFIRVLDEEMEEIQHAHWDDLLDIWFSQIKKHIRKRIAEQVQQPVHQANSSVDTKLSSILRKDVDICSGPSFETSHGEVLEELLSQGAAEHVMFLDILCLWKAPVSPTSGSDRWHIQSYELLLRLIRFLEIPERQICANMEWFLGPCQEFDEYARTSGVDGIPGRFRSEMERLQTQNEKEKS